MKNRDYQIIAVMLILMIVFAGLVNNNEFKRQPQKSTASNNAAAQVLEDRDAQMMVISNDRFNQKDTYKMRKK